MNMPGHQPPELPARFSGKSIRNSVLFRLGIIGILVLVLLIPLSRVKGLVSERLFRAEGAKKEIAFGSQIRSYVLQPYQMIKDHRTKLAEGQVDKVLNGDLDAFITTYLMQKATGTLGQPSADDDDQ